MLTELGLRNFKPFGASEATVPLSKINLIYGPNSGGKSSIIQALLMLKQSAEYIRPGNVFELVARGQYVDLGGFLSMVHRHQVDLPLSIRIDLNYGSNISIGMTFQANKDLGTDSSLLSELTYKLAPDNGSGMIIHLAREEATDDPNEHDHGDPVRFGWKTSSSLDSYIRHICEMLIEERQAFEEFPRRHRYPRSRLSRQRTLYSSYVWRRAMHGALDHEEKSSFKVGSISPILRDLLKDSTLGVSGFYRLLPHQVSIPSVRETVSPNPEGVEGTVDVSFHKDGQAQETAKLEITDIVDYMMFPEGGVSIFAQDFERLLRDISYLGPILNDPERYSLRIGRAHPTVGRRGEFTYDMISYDSVIREAVNRWFERFEIPYVLTVGSNVGDELTGGINSIPLMDTRTNTRVTPVDIGYGISQILPVIVEGIASASRVICVEQPEVHLHPRLQAQIADLMVETSRGEDGKQWIVETHSELLVRRIQTRLAEKAISPDDITVLYVNPTQRGSIVSVIEVDEQGNYLDEWPDGFFEEGYIETMQKRRARSVN